VRGGDTRRKPHGPAGGNKSNNGRRLKSNRLKLAAGCDAERRVDCSGLDHSIVTWKWNVVGHFVRVPVNPLHRSDNMSVIPNSRTTAE